MSELNLIPYSLREKKIKERKIRNYSSYALILFSLLFISVYIPKLRLNSLNKDIVSLKAELTDSAPILNENKELKDKFNLVKDYIAKVDAVSKSDKSTIEKLKQLETAIPKDIIIRSLNYDKNGTLAMSGETKNYNSIAEFTANLEVSNNYKKVFVTNVTNNSQQSQTAGYSFTINVEF